MHGITLRFFGPDTEGFTSKEDFNHFNRMIVGCAVRTAGHEEFPDLAAFDQSFAVGTQMPRAERADEAGGSAEGGMREFKSVFYNVWERRKREGADKEKSLLSRVEAAMAETIQLLNEQIPRPCLGGVTPADVHCDRQEEKQRQVREYREAEQERRDVAPWKRSYREILKSGLKLKEMASSEVVTKLAFFGRKPLRRIAQRNREGVG